jgi:hypothetical protein
MKLFSEDPFSHFSARSGVHLPMQPICCGRLWNAALKNPRACEALDLPAGPIDQKCLTQAGVVARPEDESARDSKVGRRSEMKMARYNRRTSPNYSVAVQLAFDCGGCAMKPSQILDGLFEHTGRQLSLAYLRDKCVGSIHGIVALATYG